MIGLIAAAISTSDSQLFALGGELRSILKGDSDKQLVSYARVGILFFAVLSLILAIMSTDELVLLARTSFAGTSLLAPLIFTGVFYEKAPLLKQVLPIATVAGLALFIASLIGWLPNQIIGIRMDLTLLFALSLIAVGAILVSTRKKYSL